MEVLYPRCCGLDVPKSSITACVLTKARLLSLSNWAGSDSLPPPRDLSGFRISLNNHSRFLDAADCNAQIVPEGCGI
jgi:hypothetical protein